MPRIFVILALFALSALLCTGCETIRLPARPLPGPDSSREAPIWSSPRIHGESLFFVRDHSGEPPRAQLAFVAKSDVRIVHPATGASFSEPLDFVLSEDRRTIRLTAGSRIPFKNRPDMYPAPGDPNSIAACVREGEHLFWGEGHLFHDLQVEASYRHAKGEWKDLGGYVPRRAHHQLTNTMRLLRKGGGLRIALLGDSISEGYNASKFTGASPSQSPYGELVSDRLRSRYRTPIEFANFARAGTNSAWGAEQAARVAAWKPNLVIVAFGMNDASGRIPSESYLANIRRIIETVSNSNRECEFILVSTMTGNPEWTASSSEHYSAYRVALATLNDHRTVLVDLTEVWRKLLERKTFWDLTGNGVNHPNDFGHRIYAQFILGVLE